MSKEQEQLKQMVDSIRYIFICDYCINNENDFTRVYKGTIVEIEKVSRQIDEYLDINSGRVSFLLGTKTISMPIDDFRFCTKSFDSREIQIN